MNHHNHSAPHDWPKIISWIETTVDNLGLALLGEPAIDRARPWSLVATVATTDGRLWFKAGGGDSTYEARLLSALAQWTPGRVLTPLAVDAERGWVLMPDGGHTVREMAAHDDASRPDSGASGEVSPDDLARWQQILVQHAELQQAVAPHTATMIELGVPDQRPVRMVGWFEGLLALPDVRNRLDADDLAKLQGHRGIEAACERLSSSPVPATLQHDDLHDGNVFAGGQTFDWGDAAVAHPFGVLLVTLRVFAHRYRLDPDHPVLAQLRDAYLESWRSVASEQRLAADVVDAIHVAKVGRALSWHRALSGADAQAQTEWGDAVSGWLLETIG